MKYDKFIQTFSLITLCVLFGLIFMGGYVSSSNVGLSCPKWPLCPKGLVPSPEFLIEYIHRSIAATTGLLVFLNMIFILKAKSALKSTKIFSIIAAGAVFGQIFLGGVVITEKLHALLVTGHLGLGLILYSSLIYVVINTFYTNSKIKPFSQSSSLTSSLSSNSVGKRKSSSKFFSNNFGL